MSGTELICRKVDVINPENENVPKMQNIHSKSNEIVSNEVESSIKIGLIIALGVIFIGGCYIIFIEIRKNKPLNILKIVGSLLILIVLIVLLTFE